MSRLTLLITALALSTAACGSTTTTPDPPPDPVTDVFSGTLSPRGGVTHTFVIPRSGVVEARLSALAPDSAVIIGLALGTFSNNSCQIILSNDAATLGSVIQGQTSGSGNLCVRVYDSAGNVTEALTYDVQVTHP
jgi:hypothetical protein